MDGRGRFALNQHSRDGARCPVPLIDSAEAAGGRLGAVLAAPQEAGLTQLGRGGPWVATTPDQAKRVLMDSSAFDFPTNISRSTDPVASADTRTGRHIHAPLPVTQVERAQLVFLAEWQAATSAAGPAIGVLEFEAMRLLRRPVARATCTAVLGDLPTDSRNEVADLVLDWIDALAPVIARRRSPGRWSRVRRRETRARLALDAKLASVLADLECTDEPPIVATMLAAGVQVPIAAGAWLLVFLAAHPDADPAPDHVVWETLRLAPPTWITARVTTGPITVADHSLQASEVVLVSPLLLGRATGLVPDHPDGIGAFAPDRWREPTPRPGAWLPFGAGAHACPGRNLGFALLHDLAVWAGQHHLELASSVSFDQSRGILPAPSRVIVRSRDDSTR